MPSLQAPLGPVLIPVAKDPRGAQVGGLPRERVAASALVTRTRSPLKAASKRSARPFPVSVCENGAAGGPHDRQRVAVLIGYPDVRAVEDREPRGHAQGHRLQDRSRGASTSGGRPGPGGGRDPSPRLPVPPSLVRDPHAGPVEDRRRRGGRGGGPAVTVVTVHGVVAPRRDDRDGPVPGKPLVGRPDAPPVEGHFQREHNPRLVATVVTAPAGCFGSIA